MGVDSTLGDHTTYLGGILGLIVPVQEFDVLRDYLLRVLAFPSTRRETQDAATSRALSYRHTQGRVGARLPRLVGLRCEPVGPASAGRAY